MSLSDQPHLHNFTGRTENDRTWSPTCVTSLYQSQGRAFPGSHDALRRATGTPQNTPVHARTLTEPLQHTPVHGRTFFIINATDEVGFHTAQLLAVAGCTVLVHGKNAEKVNMVVKELKLQFSNSRVHGFVADLSLMSDVRELAKKVSSRHPALHGLLYCTETFSGKSLGRHLTSEGKEYSLAVNVMAPFLLTSLMLDCLQASGYGRVVITTTESAESDKALVDIHDYIWYEKRWTDSRACEMSKLCGHMLIIEMHQRFANPPRLCFHALDPGIKDTNMRRFDPGTFEGNKKMMRRVWAHAGTSVRTITADRSFQMLTEDHFQYTSGETICCGSGSTPRLRRKLWEDLEAITGAKYPAPKNWLMTGPISSWPGHPH